MVKKQRSFASRSSSSSRPGLERAVSQADPVGPDDDAASVLSGSLSWGERVCGSTQVSSKHHSHGTLGPKSPPRPNVPSPPDPKPVIWLVSMGIRLYRRLSFAALTLLTVRTPHWAILPWARYLQDRSPWSESICRVDRLSSCDTCHNARLAMKGSVQQSPVDGPVYSEHAPVTPVPGTGTLVPVPGVVGGTEHWVNRVQWPHRAHRSYRVHRVQRSHRANRSDQSTLVRKLNWKRPTSAWPSLSFLFLIHRSHRCN